MRLEACGSVMYFGVPLDLRFGGLLFYLLREKGVFALEGFPLYLTTEHSDADIDRILRAFEESIAEMQSCGFFPGHIDAEVKPFALSSAPQPQEATVTVTELPLTEPQLEIMLAAQVSDEANCAFNESFRLSLEGTLDEEALRMAWRSLLERHDALRMSLVPAGDRMRIHRGRPIAMQECRSFRSFCQRAARFAGHHDHRGRGAAV